MIEQLGKAVASGKTALTNYMLACMHLLSVILKERNKAKIIPEQYADKRTYNFHVKNQEQVLLAHALEREPFLEHPFSMVI